MQIPIINLFLLLFIYIISVVLYVAGNYVVTDLQANDGFWHFICVTWQSLDGQWEVFLDGVLFSNGTGLASNNKIKGGGKLVCKFGKIKILLFILLMAISWKKKKF